MEKLGRNEVSYVRIELDTDDGELIGVGIEVGRNARDSFYPAVIMSLAIRRDKFGSTFKLLEYVIDEALKYVPETDKLVIFNSTNLCFKHQHKRFKKGFSKKVEDKDLLFYHVENTSLITKTLAQDALKLNRRDSIVEILRGKTN